MTPIITRPTVRTLLTGVTASDGQNAIDVATSGPRARTASPGYRVTFWDDFTRADGPIDGQTAPSGQVWHDVGTGAGIVPGAIASNAFGCPRGSGTARNYSEIILDAIPDMVGGALTFTGSTGVNNSCVFLIGDANSSRSVSGFRNSMVHVVIGPSTFEVDVTNSGSGGLITVASYNWTAPLDGTPCSFLIERAGSTVTITPDNGQGPYTFTHALIASVWGASLICEAFYNDPSQDVIPTFDCVWAGVADTSSALLVEGAATNYHTNPSVEGTGTSGFGASGSSTISQSTDWNSPNDPGSTHSVKVVTGNVAGQSGVNCNSLTGLAIAAGVNVFAASVDVNMTQALPYAAVLSVFYQGGGSKTATYANTLPVGVSTIRVGPLTADPTKIIDQVTLAVRCTQFNTVTTFYVDAVNLRRSHRSLGHVWGGAGAGFSFAGVANLSASLRAVSTCSVDAIGVLSPLVGSVLMRVQRQRPSLTDQVLLDIGDGDTGHDRLRLSITSANVLTAEWTSDGASPTTVALSSQLVPMYAPVDLYVWWDGTDSGLAIFNSAAAIGSRNAPKGTWGTRTDAVIGSDRAGGNAASAFVASVVMDGQRLRKDQLRTRTRDRSVWTWRGEDADSVGAALANLDAAISTRLPSSSYVAPAGNVVLTTAPIALNGTVTLYKHTDHAAAETRSLDWRTEEDATWPDLTGASIQFASKSTGGGGGISATGSVITPTGATKHVRVELTPAATDDVLTETQTYQVRATLSNGHVIPLAAGRLLIEPYIPAL